MLKIVTIPPFQLLNMGKRSEVILVLPPSKTRVVSIQKNLPPYIWLLREFAWNCIPMFKPQSLDCLLFLTSTFQPREWSRALPNTHTRP